MVKLKQTVPHSTALYVARNQYTIRILVSSKILDLLDRRKSLRLSFLQWKNLRLLNAAIIFIRRGKSLDGGQKPRAFFIGLNGRMSR